MMYECIYCIKEKRKKINSRETVPLYLKVPTRRLLSASLSHQKMSGPSMGGIWRLIWAAG